MSLKTVVLSRYIWPRQACVRGPRVAEYEKAFAAATGARFAVGFWKGRVAFYGALRALGVGPGDEVIMPGYTCLVIPAAVRRLGARPVYVDIEPSTCTLDPDRLENALSPRTKAIMIQHTYGWPSAGLDSVMELAGDRGVPVIEDCCHALGTKHNGHHVGNLGIGGFFSSQWSKPYTTGLGGMLICNDPDFNERVRRLRDQDAAEPPKKTSAQLAVQGIAFDMLVYPTTMAIARRAYRWLSNHSILTGSTAVNEYTGESDDYFRRISQVQAAAGLFELEHLDRAIAHRQHLTSWYREALSGAGWPMAPAPSDEDVTLLRFPVRVNNKLEALEQADRSLIELGDWFVCPLHSHLARQENFGYSTGMCPKADQAAHEIINLPLHSRVSLRQARRIVDFLSRNCRPPPGGPGF